MVGLREQIAKLKPRLFWRWSKLQAFAVSPLFNVGQYIAVAGPILAACLPLVLDRSRFALDPDRAKVYFVVLYFFALTLLFARLLLSARCPYVVKKNHKFEDYIVWLLHAADAIKRLGQYQLDVRVHEAEERIRAQKPPAERESAMARAREEATFTNKGEILEDIDDLLAERDATGKRLEISDKWDAICNERPVSRALISILYCLSAMAFCLAVFFILPDAILFGLLHTGLVEFLGNAFLQQPNNLLGLIPVNH